MGGYAQSDPLSETLGLPPEMASQIRKRGILPRLLSIGQDEYFGSKPNEGGPRLAQLMNPSESGQPYHDPGMSAPESTYSANGQTRLVDNVQNHRIEDDRSRSPYGDAEAMTPVTQATPDRPVPDVSGLSLSGRSPLREAMNAAIPPPPDMSGLRLRDAVMDSPLARPSVLPPTSLTEAQANLAKAEQPSGVSRLMTKARGIHNPFLRGLGEVGAGLASAADVAGSILEPRAAMMIPGTSLNRAMHIGGAQDRLARAEQEDLREAQADNLRSEAETRRAKPDLEQTAAGRRQLANQYGLQGDDAIRYILTGQMPVAADKPNLDEQIGNRARFADQYGLQGPERQRYILTGQMASPNDKPDTAAQQDERYRQIQTKLRMKQPVSSEDQAWAQSYERQKTLGPSATASAADVRLGRQQQFQIDKEAREEINKAQKTYRDAKEAGDALNGFIDLAQSGNKEAGATVPLEGTLRIVTSQGVKRINRTEVEGIEGAGSLFDRIQAKIGKWTKGQPIPPDLLNDFQQLNTMLTQNAYQQYSDTYDQTRQMYEAYGTDFRKIPKITAPGQQLKDQVRQKAGGAPAGMVRFQDSQGGIHDIPRQNLEKARQRDPGLRVLSQ